MSERGAEILAKFVNLANRYRLKCSKSRVAGSFVFLRKLTVAALNMKRRRLRIQGRLAQLAWAYLELKTS